MIPSRILKINKLNIDEAKELLSQCCGAKKWVDRMMNVMPFNSGEEIFRNAEEIWYSLNKEDWLEAFSRHPKIGDLNSLKEKYPANDLAGREQSKVKEAAPETLTELAAFNESYEKKFGYIFIVCATGKTALEMLEIIRERIDNDPETEIRTAMSEQNKITKLRLEKLL